MRWRTRSILQESFLNLGARNIMPVVTLMIGLLGLVLVELFHSSQLLDLRGELVDSGRYVATVESEQPALLNSRCSELEALNGVVAAGSDVTPVLGSQAILVSALSAPRSGFLVSRATPGALRVWDPSMSWSGDWGVVVGEAAAEELGLRPGMWVTFSNSWHSPVLAVPSSKRNGESSRRIILLSPPTELSSRCWVEFTPAAFTAGTELLSAWFPVNRPTFVRPLHRESEFTRDPEREFSTRPQRLAWLAVGIAGVLVLWYGSWARRTELALYAAMNLRASGRLLMTQTEALLQIAVAWLASMLWGTAAHVAAIGWPTQGQMALVARSSGSAALVMLILAPFGVFVVTRRNVAQMLKDR